LAKKTIKEQSRICLKYPTTNTLFEAKMLIQIEIIEPSKQIAHIFLSEKRNCWNVQFSSCRCSSILTFFCRVDVYVSKLFGNQFAKIQIDVVNTRSGP